MKLIINTILGILYCNLLLAQSPSPTYQGTTYGWVQYRGVYGADSGQVFLPIDTGSRDEPIGTLRLKASNKEYYTWDGSKWKWILANAAGGGASIDTTSLSNRINQKVGFSDTASMLLPYARKQALNDTASALRAAIASATPSIDTTLYSTRAWRKKGDDSLGAIIATKVGYVDTASMLNQYLRKADTASLSNRINAKQDALTLTTTGTSGAATLIGSTLNIPNYSTGSGTVTSIATTNGTGITGGTITTSGTLAIDTTLIATRSWRKKGDDSLGAIVATKLNITDTANMRVRLAAGANITLTGTYPNITIAASGGSSLTGYTDGASTGNTALGSGAASGTLTDFNNTNIGYLAGNSLGAGGDQVAVGSSALRFNVSGVQNTGIGSSALRSTTGSYNTGVGFRALYTNSTGTNNGAFGYQSLYSNTSGQYNYAFGSLSLYSNTTARYNVGVGDQVLFSNSTGWYNAAIGSQALYNTTGQYNVGIGYNSGNNLTSGSGNLCLGYNTNVASATADNQLNISNLIFGTGLSGSVSSPAGNIGIGTSAPIANGILDVSSTSKSFYPPRMTTTQRDAMTGVQAGAVIYNTTVGAHQSYNGSSWSSLGNSWSLTGNAGTTAGTNFIGTTDANDFVVKRNNVEQIRLQSDRVKLTGAIQGEAGAGDIKLLDGASNQVFRGIRSNAWSDFVNSMFFQVGNANDYALFSAASGSSFARFMIQAERFQISNAYNATAPTDRFEILSQTTGAKVFAVDNSGNAKVTTTTGMLVPPVMTATQAEAISSKTIGGIIYSTDGSGTTITSSGWWGWNGTTWNKLN